MLFFQWFGVLRFQSFTLKNLKVPNQQALFKNTLVIFIFAFVASLFVSVSAIGIIISEEILFERFWLESIVYIGILSPLIGPLFVSGWYVLIFLPREWIAESENEMVKSN